MNIVNILVLIVWNFQVRYIGNQKLTVREATLGDRDAVLRVSPKLHNDLDYLPALYERFLTCKYTKSYVAILEDNVVSGSSLCFIINQRR